MYEHIIYDFKDFELLWTTITNYIKCMYSLQLIIFKWFNLIILDLTQKKTQNNNTEIVYNKASR